MTLNPHTVLRRAPELKLRLDSSNYTFIETEAGTIEGGIHGLAVINAFAAPITVAEAVGNLSAGSSGLQDWIGLTSTIVKLHEAGILLRPDAAQPSLKRTTSGFDAARIHVQMLDDRARTASYLAAIAAVVKPDDVVVDIGTGTGILALAAARAGARRVYAVEASSMGTVAEQLFRANGLSDRVTLVPGWSTQIELPELADVLISEVIGNDPLGEQVLEITADARRRLVKPDARLIPHQMKIHGVAVSIPESELARRTFRAQAAQAWQDWYSFNFQPLVDIARHAELTFFVRPHTVKAWPRLSGPFELAEVRLAELTVPRLAERTVRVNATAAGQVNGFLVTFELQLGDDVVFLSNHPDTAVETCSWSLMVSACPPRDVGEGDELAIRYGYAGAGRFSRVQLLPREA